MKHYDSFFVEAKDGDRNVSYYADGEIIFESSSAYTVASGYQYKEYHEILAKDYYCGISEDGYYSIVQAGGEIDVSWTDYLMINPELFVCETVRSSREENGKIIFKTRLTEETMIELGYWSDGPYDKCYYETEYIMDKDTKIITGIKENFVDKKNKTTNSLEYVMTVNAQRPEKAVDIHNHATRRKRVRRPSFSIPIPKTKPAKPLPFPRTTSFICIGKILPTIRFIKTANVRRFCPLSTSS